MDEQRVWHLVPLNAALYRNIYLTPTGEPETLEDMQLCIVVVVLSTKQTIEACSMRQVEHRGIEIDDATALLVVDIGLTRSIAQTGRYFRRLHELVVAKLVERLTFWGVQCGKRHIAAGLVLLHLSVKSSFQSPVSLVIKGHLLAIVEHHLVGLGPLHGHNKVILICIQETVAGRTDVIRRLKSHHTAWELMWQVLFGV